MVVAEVWSAMVNGHAGGRTAERSEVVGSVRAPGRPRSEKADKAILDATVDLIAEGSTVSELSIEAIAARAGVGKTTIYRRWSNKEDLIAAALATLKAPVPETRGMSVAEGLVAYLRLIQQEACHPRARCIMNIAMSEAERHPRLVERFDRLALEPRRVALRALLRRGIDEGVLDPGLDIDIAAAALTGVMLYLVKWDRRDKGELPADIPERVLDHLMRGLGTRPQAGEPA